MPNLDDIMKMAQDAQAELQRAQDKLDTVEVEGASGGGLVRIRATAKGRILGVAIDDSLMIVSEKSMLEDLVAARSRSSAIFAWSRSEGSPPLSASVTLHAAPVASLAALVRSRTKSAPRGRIGRRTSVPGAKLTSPT